MQHGTVYVLYDRVEDKYYVGQTSRDLAARLEQHLLSSWAGSRTPLHQAIRRAGSDNIFLVRVDVVPRSDLKSEEQRLAVAYGCYYPEGYNVAGSGMRSTTRHRRKLTKYEDLIVDAYTTHQRSLAQIATFYDVAIGTVRHALLRRGVQLRSPGRPTKDCGTPPKAEAPDPPVAPSG